VVVVRPYRAGDRDAVYDVCLRTATGPFADPDLVGDVYAGPYLFLAPELAFVLDDGSRAVGYVVGAADSVRFYADMGARWLPRCAGRQNPAPSDRALAELLRQPGRQHSPALAKYPAHLHVNLLPAHRRHGHGTALLDAEFAALRTSGAAAVHLGVATANTAAQAFYGRLGFQHIDVPQAGPTTFLGRRLA
jgi:ribosomal protein S18 acetylase RimI-like enzyme